MAGYGSIAMPASLREYSRKASIVGIGESDFHDDYQAERKKPEGYEAPTLEGLMSKALDRALVTALCLVSPSSREGYGRVVIESSARGVPVVLVAGPDNAATELVEEGVNGTVAASAEPDDLADAIVRVHDAGSALRESTVDWFRANAERLSLDRSLEVVVEAYGGD